ncbi:MAG: Gfo/Idh/MocA family oxidoreductase [Planctomycetota bacterium]|nr:Gfo/Idh/MocA family oxidoreductase [Planctomycetota bacterium]
MAKPEIRIALIGTKFMGKAHSNAWAQVAHFFDLPVKPVMQVVVGRDRKGTQAMADTWGWAEASTDWESVIARKDIDLVDVSTPNNVHAGMAIAALKAGKHVVCEKPLAMNVKECEAMTKAAKAARKANFVCYNYRRVPAVSLARQLVQEGRIGRVYHVRCVYLQSWIMDPNFPLVWRLQGDVAGSGPHGDLNAHIIDAARFITGEEVTEVSAAFETFIKERPLGAMTGGLSAKGGSKKGKVTVEDAALLIGRMSGGGLCSFEATRFAQGRKNGNAIEINGEKGALRFEFEDMNRLKYYDASRPSYLQGWTDILATEADHPYFGHYWPAGHIIGYEHTFINIAADVLEAVGKGGAALKKLSPDFADSTNTQRVLEAAEKSAKSRKWVKTGCK